MPELNPEKLASRYLGTARIIAKSKRGAIILAKKMSQLLGHPVARQQIQQWTRDKEPIEPRLGHGIILAIAAQEIQEEKDLKAKQLAEQVESENQTTQTTETTK